ncbi:hypothetical protein BMF94_1971 [Rhodotorula taiwanensis]|uniref:Uncharacterized protein n=1 Tax=Rhodotorula taiwanensis TaxID=741276 RepID=A0A2S5BDZ2_9BASI|nr:hypothetical protein BMF94_1971 [Rhodotorula taiwanensis]
MKPPDIYKLVTLLEASETRSEIIKTLALAGDEEANKIIESLLPYLTLPTLLLLRKDRPSLGQVITDKLYNVVDAQRDWVVSADCPIDRRDSYLVRVFDETWDGLVKPGMTEIAGARQADVRAGMILDHRSPYRQNALQSCKDLASFRQALQQASGGLLDKLDWTNVVLAGGAVLGILTGQVRFSTYSASDIDLFLVGLQKDELLPKVRSMIQQIQVALASVLGKGMPSADFSPTALQAEYAELSRREPNVRQSAWADQFPDRLLILKGFNAITLVPPLGFEPRRPIQIVLNSAPTVYDALACRKGDPSAAVASGRALKYAQRGFAFVLPGPAKGALDGFGLKYVETVKRLRTDERAQQQTRREPDVTRLRTEDLAGLPGLLRREAIQRRRDERNPPPHSDDITLDYGYRTASWIKVVSQADLQAKANGQILREFYNYAAKDVAVSIENSLLTVDKAVAEHAEYIPGAPTKRHKGLQCPLGRDRPYADYVVPYVASFDRDFVLGFKADPADPYAQEWTQIRNLQYIIKLPKSLLPVLDKGSETMSALISEAILSSSDTLGGMSGEE